MYRDRESKRESDRNDRGRDSHWPDERRGKTHHGSDRRDRDYGSNNDREYDRRWERERQKETDRLLKRREDYPKDHEESPVSSRNHGWKQNDRYANGDRVRHSKYQETDRNYRRYDNHTDRSHDRYGHDDRGRRGYDRLRSKNGHNRYDDSSDSSQDSRRPKRKVAENIQDRKDRLARLELLKYDEEYKELVPKTEEKDQNKDETATLQDLQKLELCKKLGVNPVLLEKFGEELKISESKAPEQPQQDPQPVTFKRERSFEDLDLDTHSRSVKSKSEHSKVGQFEVDPLDEFMSEIQKTNPQLAQTALKLTGNDHIQDGFSADFQTPQPPLITGNLTRNIRNR